MKRTLLLPSPSYYSAFFCLFCLHLFDPALLSFFILHFTSFPFPAFILSTNHRAWTRLPWPMPPFWMAAGAGPMVPWLAQWVPWLSVFLLSPRSLILSTPQRWAYQGTMEARTGSMEQFSETDNKMWHWVFGRLLFRVVECCTDDNDTW